MSQVLGFRPCLEQQTTRALERAGESNFPVRGKTNRDLNPAVCEHASSPPWIPMCLDSGPAASCCASRTAGTVQAIPTLLLAEPPVAGTAAVVPPGCAGSGRHAPEPLNAW